MEKKETAFIDNELLYTGVLNAGLIVICHVRIWEFKICGMSRRMSERSRRMFEMSRRMSRMSRCMSGMSRRMSRSHAVCPECHVMSTMARCMSIQHKYKYRQTCLM